MQALEPSCGSSSSDPSAVKGWQMHLAKTDWFRLANTIPSIGSLRFTTIILRYYKSLLFPSIHHVELQ